jgi:hypothetical protein
MVLKAYSNRQLRRLINLARDTGGPEQVDKNAAVSAQVQHGGVSLISVDFL